VKNTGLSNCRWVSPSRHWSTRSAKAHPGGEKRIKAVQSGGPSGGCIPADKFDTPIDYEALAEIGAIMGSGGMVVLDQDNCMVDTARYFVEFTKNESCGKCVPCREGLAQELELLDKVVKEKRPRRTCS
jgi:NADH-quinone oxidoreductase subunit F